MTDIRIIRLGMNNDGTATDAQGGGAGLTNTMIEAETTAGNVALAEYIINYDNIVSICTDYSGNIYGVDSANHCIVKITEGGVVSWVAGSLVGASGNNGTQTVIADVARFNEPVGIACDKYGTLYIADSHNHQIRTYKNGMVGVLAGSAGNSGFQDSSKFAASGDATQGFSALLNHPDDVCVDKAGVVYVADRGNNAIRKITSDGYVTTIAGITATGASGDLPSAVVPRVQPSNFTACLNYPTAITVDAMGNLFIADMNNNKIKKLSPDGWLTRYSGSGNVGKSLGATYDGTEATLPAYTCSYAGLYDVASDNSGNIFVIDHDTTRSRLIRVDRDGSPFVVADWDSNDYHGPYALAVSPNQTVFVVNMSSEESSSTSSSSMSSTGGRQ